MRRFLLIILSALVLMQGCTNQSLRDEEKFSRLKSYAVLPFNSSDKDLGLNLSAALKDWLVTDDYKIISQKDFDKLLSNAHLTADQIAGNYSVAINQLKGVDAIIIGNISMDKKLLEGDNGLSLGAGGSKNMMSGCDVYVIDLTSGDILAKAHYEATGSSEMMGTDKCNEVGKKLAIKLSPH